MSAEGTSVVGRPGGILPQKIFKFGGFKTLFSALVMRHVSEKSTSNHEIGKQLQVTIIKVTESKENKSIHRLDVSASAGPEGAAAPLVAPPPPGYSFVICR